MSVLNSFGGIVITYILIQAVIQIMNFYDVPFSSYSIYLSFFVFLIVSGFVLPSRVGE